MPTQPEGASSETTSANFLAKLETIPDKDVERFVAWQPVLHYYTYINGADAPDIETLQARAKETGWTAQVNSIASYLRSSHLIRDVTEVVSRFFESTPVFQKHQKRFEILGDARWIEVVESASDKAEREKRRESAKPKKTVQLQVTLADNKTMISPVHTDIAQLLTAYWHLKHPGCRLIESGKTSSVKTSEELLAFWKTAFSPEAIAKDAAGFKTVLITLMQAVVSDEKLSV